MTLRILLLDAYARSGRDALAAAGCTVASELYRKRLAEIATDVSVDIAFAADPDFALPLGVALADYDGVLWTGSSLSICKADDPAVRRQVELARAGFEAGRTSFGSCWAAQLAAVAAGGACAPSPRGREFGVSRKIAPTEAGRSHPLFAGRPAAFDALTTHADEIVHLPEGATCLASNEFCRVQAIDVEHAGGRFQAVQYHPEYDLHEVARLCAMRSTELVAQGTFANREAALGWAERVEALHRDPGRADLAYELGVDADVLDPEQRLCEVRNWLDSSVRPVASAR